MDIAELINPKIRTQPIYEPGKPIEEVAREIGLDLNEICKLASNENPLGASPLAIQAATDALNKVHLYPDGASYYLKESLSQHWNLEPNQFTLGNGSNEVIELIGHAFLKDGDEVLMGSQAFIVYKLVTLLFGAIPVEVEMPDYKHDLSRMLDKVHDKTKLVFLPSPNNPTGTANTENEIYEFVRALPDSVIFCFDEAYAEYNQEAPNLLPLIEEGRKVIGLRTFSKIYGLAGLRIGYSYSNSKISGLLNQVREPFNINSIAQVAAVAALKDKNHVRTCREQNKVGRDLWSEELEALGIPYIPSQANFILAKVGNAQKLFFELQDKGVITRPMKPYGLENHLRISIGTCEQNKHAVEVLKGIYNK